MRILFEIAHPKHVHLFHNAITVLQSRGHEIGITAREKDVTVALLEGLGYKAAVLSTAGKGLFGLGREFLVRDFRLWRYCRQFKPDVIVARVGPCACLVSRIMGRPSIVFDDTEHATVQQKLAYPFASRICTGEHYEKDWGSKHLRYRSLDELAYLHPKRFTPSEEVVKRAGLEPGKYIIVRFVGWQAAHDLGKKGFSEAIRREVVAALQQFDRVIITSESALPKSLKPFTLSVPVQDFHHVLAFARLCFCESTTVASEAAVLGVPSVLVISKALHVGYVKYLAERYGLLHYTEELKEGLSIAEQLMKNPNTSKQWGSKRQTMLEHEEDLTDWMVREIERLGAAG